MKYITVTIILVVALILTTHTNDSFFSMLLISEPLALLFARGISFNATPSGDYRKDYKKIMRRL